MNKRVLRPTATATPTAAASVDTRRGRTSQLRAAIAALVVLAMTAAVGLVPGEASAQGAGQFVFQGSGWGHGVGMSQHGAKNMAARGMTHSQILAFYYPNAVVAPVPPLDRIRVHLGDAATVELTSANSITFERGGVAINAIPSGSIRISAHEGGIQIGNAWTTATPADPVFVSFPEPLKLSNNGHRYLWGRLQITNRNGKVRVVEVLPFEKYVAGISEVPTSWPLESLMAQAIAARTYAHEITQHRRNSVEWAQEYDISGSTVDQNYIGYDAQDSAWDQKWLAAVTSTAGLEIVGSNGPIRAYYSASNGGYTETAAYVFGNDVPYTVAGPDPHDAGGHDWTNWTRTYSQQSISRWLNASTDTSVGTLTAINVLGGAGASARLDRAMVELVGTAATKRVTGRRLMLVMNAGMSREGGTLATHLPGTFATIGNGAGVGFPAPGGIQLPAPVPSATAAPTGATSAVAPSTSGYVPPPGWTPVPGTGVPPGAPVEPAANSAAPASTPTPTPAAAVAPPAGSSGYVPPPGWTPVPGTGVPPSASTAAVDTASDQLLPAQDDPAAASAPAVSAESSGYVPPPGWTPVPGTGVPPITPAGAVTTASAQLVPAGDDIGITPDAGAGGTGFVPPPGWTPEPGTGVPPLESSVPTSVPVPPVVAEPTATAVQAIVVETASVVPAADPSGYIPPPGWTPVPGTGVPPTLMDRYAAGLGAQAAASGVLLVTRSANSAASSDTTFQVLEPTDGLAAAARDRLTEAQTKAAVALFADIDVRGYVAALAPRPVHAVCMAGTSGITCVPIASLQPTAAPR